MECDGPSYLVHLVYLVVGSRPPHRCWRKQRTKKRVSQLIGICLGWRIDYSYVLHPYLEYLSDLGHLYVKEQKECDVQAECETLGLWLANYLPFEPGTPSVPLTPGTPSVPSLPRSPRDVWWNMHPT